tara:strand:+ start:3480 stop:3677 length:198 start_codon:yes stop_codon:yes gene_type:complete
VVTITLKTYWLLNYTVAKSKKYHREYSKKYREADKEISKKYRALGVTGSFSAFRKQEKKNKKSLI